MTQPVNHGSKVSLLNAQPSANAPDIVSGCVGEQNFQHWFKNRCRFEVCGDCLMVFVPNPFISNWMMKRFRVQLTQAAHQLLGPSGCFQLTIDEALLENEDAAAPATLTTAAITSDLSVSGKAPAALPDRPESRQQTPDEPKLLAVRAPQRRRFRKFSSFVSGPCNDLALLAARQVAEAPGERFNPLYIHGATGTGKTHLMESVYSEIRRTQPALNVMFLSSEGFTNYFTQALESRTVPSFRQRFRNVDVLLIDNIEFLDNKKATQEEFLHTMVQLIEHNGQIVISADRHPRMLTRHREEITTRFVSGLVCRIEAPSEELRLRLTHSLALPNKECFTEETLNYIARKCRKNVREIQGALNCLHGHFTLTRRKITVARAREILGEMEQECQRLIRINDVERVICEAFGLTVTDLRSKSRRRAVACPRSLAMFIARKLTRFAYREIGMYFGGRDHSTVVAAEKRVARWIASDEPVNLPNSCRGRTVADVVSELEERLVSLAS